MRGAREGLVRAEWMFESSGPLSELADTAGLPVAERGPRVRAISERLGLRRLTRFYQRVFGDAA